MGIQGFTSGAIVGTGGLLRFGHAPGLHPICKQAGLAIQDFIQSPHAASLPLQINPNVLP